MAENLEKGRLLELATKLYLEDEEETEEKTNYEELDIPF